MKRPVLLFLALLLLTSGCATARAHPGEARYLAVSAADAVTTWAALDGGAREVNPIYGNGDALTVAATSLALSVAATWALHRVAKKLPPHQRKKLWFTVTAIRSLAVPINLNTIAQQEEREGK